jgi:hypothetical protein
MITEPIRKTFPWRRYLLVFLLIVLVICAPMISVLTSMTIAKITGCTLHEGFTNTCSVLGFDIGDTLHTMFLMGWFMLLTIPYGIIILILMIATCLVHAVIHHRRSR